MNDKKRILVIADSPLVPSGVGTQTKYMIDALIKTGKYKFFCLAGAIRHKDYRLQKVDNYGDDWIIKPVDGYGDPNIIRAVLRDFKPDVLWFMTDPRFYVWLWQMEDEIRPNVPMVYYHVWDNYPYPMYNKVYYDSNDMICTISKVTDDIVKTVSPEVESIRIPHTVDTNIFRKSTKESDSATRKLIAGDSHSEKTIFFWNNRNARRKQSGTLLYWFKDFLDKVGHQNACLVMHTEPKDPHGQDLVAIANNLNLGRESIMFSTQKMSAHDLANVYSAVDCTINISDAEGFGLSTLESLSCETPIIVSLTGGLQEQVTDGVNSFGFGIKPCSKAIIGSQEVPYIYEDRLNKEEFLIAMEKFYHMSKEDRIEMGRLSRQHVLNNYGFESYSKQWQEVIEKVIDKHGSWETRKNYKHWGIVEIK
tara:strand:+ start:129 stop:1391 length:1263 start_codon:yes stop_codon:yes gene_type:complete